MISRNSAVMKDDEDLWTRLAAPVPEGTIAWRQDGNATAGRDGHHYARFVAYIEANTVRERLDSVVPGNWDLTIELLPPLGTDGTTSFKGRLQILGVIREDVGTGKDYKAAATDAFKRAAVRFGIAHELHAYEQNWVRVDVSGKYPKPLEDPAEAYERQRRTAVVATASVNAMTNARTDGRTEDDIGPRPIVPMDPTRDRTVNLDVLGTDQPPCPVCGGMMWDNRTTKQGNQPDFKCKKRPCNGAIWLTPKAAVANPPAPPAQYLSIDDDIPF